MNFEPSCYLRKTATGIGRGLLLWRLAMRETGMVLRADLAYAQSAANLDEYRVFVNKNFEPTGSLAI